jgi:S-DNA-T family DNA segregation ATPase FtsK/SpoIIIE
VQEPSKDIVDVRELFTTRICLGVTAASHVDMVLGDGARERGALADEIPGDEAHTGIGFVIDQGSRLPVRFRAAYVADEEIDELVTRCAAWVRPGDVIDLAQRRDGNNDQDGDDDGTAGAPVGVRA